MKKFCCLLLILLMLSGCSAPVYETLGDVVHVGLTQGQPRRVLISFPEDASLLTASGEDRLYLCNGYTLTLQARPSGDLADTVLALSGRNMEDLTVLESLCGDHKRYDFVWITNGEEGELLCRAAVLDDGQFHYSMTVMASTEDTADLKDTWNALFSSFCLDQKESA